MGRAGTPRDIRAGPAQPLVVALVVDRQAHWRIADAVGARATVRYCERTGRLLQLASDPATTAVLVEPRDADGQSTAPAIRRLATQLPSVSVIAFIGPRCPSADLLEVARAGADDLVRVGFDDVGASLRAALASGTSRRAVARVREELVPVVPRSVWSIVDHCLTHASGALSVSDLARALGVDRRTLVRRLADAGMPVPREVIGWCRLFLAAVLLEDPIRSAEQVALMLDFPSGTALRNMLARYTALRPRELRENGGLRCAVHLFRSASPSAASTRAAAAAG